MTVSDCSSQRIRFIRTSAANEYQMRGIEETRGALRLAVKDVKSLLLCIDAMQSSYEQLESYAQGLEEAIVRHKNRVRAGENPEADLELWAETRGGENV